MKTGRQIFKNMLSLSFAEIANKGISFITIAYLARVLQPEGFGIIGWANSFVVYFVFLVDLGFNVIGPREIAKYPEKLKKLVNNILSIKISFSIILYGILLGIIFLINKSEITKIVVIISGLNIFANALLLNWVFQGLEKMEIIAIRQVLTSIMNLFGVIIFVHSPNDIILAISVMIASLILNSLWMLGYYVKFYGWFKLTIDWSNWKPLLLSSIPVAITIFITILYNNFALSLLGIIRTNYEVGIYNAAFKVLAFSLVPSAILQNAFIPQLSRSISLQDKIKFSEKYILFTFIIGSIITTGFFTFSDFIMNFGFGNQYNDSSIVLKLLMGAGLLAYINVSFSAPLLSWGLERKVLWAMLSGGVINVLLNFLLIPFMGEVGSGIAAISTEATVLIGLSIIFYSIVKQLFILNFIKVFILANISNLIGYYLWKIGFNPFISGTFTFVFFISLIIVFKVITFEEIKLYLRKN